MTACAHNSFVANVEVCRLTKNTGSEMIGLSVSVTGRCADCLSHVIWHVPDYGVLADRPTVSVDGRTLRLPARLSAQPDDFGLQLPGFRIERTV